MWVIRRYPARMKLPLKRVLIELGIPDLVEKLTTEIPLSDLQTLMLATYSARATQLSASDVLEQYRTNRFVCPAKVSPIDLLRFDQLAFGLADGLFEAIELSPVCPLGTSSVHGAVNQNKAIATSRNTEVVSDSTNVMALEAAIRRRLSPETVRLCCSHRLIRGQKFSGEGNFAHFRVFGLVSAGRDTGDRRFELLEMFKHIEFHCKLLTKMGVQPWRLIVTDSKVQATTLEAFAPLKSQFPSLNIVLDSEREAAKGYYDQLCFELLALGSEGREISVVDGGATDWTRRLLSNAKERLIISGIGTDRVCSTKKGLEG